MVTFFPFTGISGSAFSIDGYYHFDRIFQTERIHIELG